MRRLIDFVFLMSFVVTISPAQLSGTKTVGSTGDYANLSAAFADINSSGVSATLTLSITESFTEPGTTGLTRSDLSATHNILIKPAASTTPVVTVSSTDGIVLNGTSYVTIDGSNSGGTSRDLSIVRSASAAGSACICLQGTSNTITVKNCVVGGATNTPDFGVRVDGSSGMQDITIQNNEIHGIGNANGIIYFNNVGGTNLITGNSITGDVNGSTMALGMNFAGNPGGGTTTVTKNRMHILKTAGGSGISGIRDALVGGTLNISNNFLGGGFVSSSTSDYFLLEFLGSATRTVVHNTLVLNSITGTPFDAANFYIQDGTADFRNNIVVNNFDDAFSYCIYNNLTTPADLTTNYNDLYAPGIDNSIGFDANFTYDPLSNWQAAFSPNFPDLNSVSTGVTFSNSSSDFHLSGGSNGDTQLRGVDSLASDDIDGDARQTNPAGPYMGADEASNALPVQMTGLVASVNGLDIELFWMTQSEVDNFGFEVERMMVQGSVPAYAGIKVQGTQPETSNLKLETNWSKVGFVKGSGTSTSPKEYSYLDRLLPPGRYAYRLRQVDRSGSFRYTEAVEIETTVPRSLSLQTYPNPFNPATVVRFTVTEPGRARVAAFNVLGERVATLFDDAVIPSYQYEIPFDASSLPSGLYVLQLKTGAEQRNLKILLTR